MTTSCASRTLFLIRGSYGKVIGFEEAIASATGCSGTAGFIPAVFTFIDKGRQKCLCTKAQKLPLPNGQHRIQSYPSYDCQ